MADVVVVGSGAGGLLAALTAARAGAQVVVLERAPVFGGTSAIGGATLWIPTNHFQMDAGIEDSLDLARTYLQGCTLGQAPVERLDNYLTNALEMLAFLEQETPVRLSGDLERPDPAYDLPGAGIGRCVCTETYDPKGLGSFAPFLRRPVPTAGWPPLSWAEMRPYLQQGDGKGWVGIAAERQRTGIVARGAALVGSLLEACLAAGVRFEHDCRVLELTMEGDAVRGVVAERDGKRESYRADRGVVLASGGFEWNREMWDDLIGRPLDLPLTPPYNEGDGLRMAMRAGAKVADLGEAYWTHTVGVPGDTQDGQPMLRLDGYIASRPGAIVVNSRGQRFSSEQSTLLPDAMFDFNPVERKFSNYPAFAIFDDECYRTNPVLAHDSGTNDDYTWLPRADSLEKLAVELGIDPAGLEAEVERFNEGARRGEDPLFHRGEKFTFQYGGVRGHTLRALGAGPYYGIQLKATVMGTNGGPVIGLNGEVLDYDDRPIPGLFATGNVAAQFYGRATTYPASGITQGPALTFGFLAGKVLSSEGQA